jgi:outer membrane protein assembly factor BamB
VNLLLVMGTMTLGVTACASSTEIGGLTGTAATASIASSAAPTVQVIDAPTTGREVGPNPRDMCASGEYPAVASYDLATGAFRWVACTGSNVRRDVTAVSADAVEVSSLSYDAGNGDRGSVWYDAASGDELNQVDFAPAKRRGSDLEVAADHGVRLVGGQDDPLAAFDSATGDELWKHESALLVYDDLWAIADGAVYVASGSSSVAAIELRSGDVRWTQTIEAPGRSYPWYAEGEHVYAIWTNLAVISTKDGAVLWHTEYPDVQFPRMTGVLANDGAVFVAFSSVASGGD